MEQLKKMCEAIRRKTDFIPEIALVLGSGLGDFVERSHMEILEVFEYKDLEGFPVSTVSGHLGRLIFGRLGDVNLVCMQGRVHYYEGYTMQQVVMPIRLMKLLGAQTLLLTNAAGGVNESFQAGDFMLITDHISSFVPSPLIGPNKDELGVRFPDMSEVYNKKICDHIRKCAVKNGIALKEGTYIQFSGPQYESPAEIRMTRTLGADAVGMSTVCEAIAANHMGMKIGAISLISNMACGVVQGAKLSHEEVKETADRAGEKMVLLMSDVIRGIREMNA